MERVVLGLSGGVDSAVAAARLRGKGFEVYGLFLELGLGGEEDARKVAEELGIPFYAAHLKDNFEKKVCTYFAEEYRQARTPNPCVVCNPEIKFRTLVSYADEIGAENIATGHYARTGRDPQGRALLMRAKSGKDQSYMLYRLSRGTLGRCIFPLGGGEDKTFVRDEARRLGLGTSEKPDSMDVCFIPDGDTQGWLERHGAAGTEGNFVDAEGRVLGRHKGLHRYTVGQRRGLGIAAESRLFVQELRQETNEVVLAFEEPFSDVIQVRDVHYIAPEYVGNGSLRCEVRVRFSKNAAWAVVYPEDGNAARVEFDTPASAPARGQSAVFYDGDVVIGGGIIC